MLDSGVKEMKNKILYIATAFYPENAVGSIRNTKIVKNLIKRNYDVTVICPRLHKSVKKDKSLRFSSINSVKIIRVDYGYIFNKIIYKSRNKYLNQTVKKNKSNKIMKKILREFYTYLKNFAFFRKAKRILKPILSNNYFDFVISSYPSLSTHLIAKWIKNQNESIKWIADFRDPIAYKSLNSKLGYKINLRLQNIFLEKADFSTVISKGVKKMMGERDDSIIYLPNGYDTDDALVEINLQSPHKKINSNILIFSYAGSLYKGKRKLNVVFEAIRELINEEKVDKDKLQFVYAGSDLDAIQSQMKVYNLHERLINLGFISRPQALRVSGLSDILLVSTWNTNSEQGIVTGKIYDSFLLKKPTIAVITGEKKYSELGLMIKKSRIGVYYEYAESENINKIKAFILKIYDKKINGKNWSLDYNAEYIQRFDYNIITNNLIKLFND